MLVVTKELAMKRADPELPVKRPPDDVVRELMRILGAPFVAILAGVPSTRTVRLWSEGAEPPEQLELLRFALQVAEVLLEREETDVVRAWFHGLNPDLDDENPLLLLAQGSAAQKLSVLEAAQRYISER